MRFAFLSILISLALLGCRMPVPQTAQRKAYDKLLTAISKQDVKTVRACLAKKVDVNWFPTDDASLQNEDDCALLDEAVMTGNQVIVSLLLDHHANPDIGDGFNYCPLAAAADNDDIAMMQLLVKRGATVNNDKNTSYSLFRAALDGKVQAVTFLLAHKANPNTNMDPDNGGSVLHLVRRFMDIKEWNGTVIEKLLLKAGAKDIPPKKSEL